MRKINIHEDILTVDQVCEILGVGKRIVEDKCRAGEIPASKRFSKWYILKSDLIKYIEEGKEKTGIIKRNQYKYCNSKQHP